VARKAASFSWRPPLLKLIPLVIAAVTARVFMPAEPLPFLGNDRRVRIIYFDVKGNSAAEIRHSLYANGPIDPFGKRRLAYTRWRIFWSWPQKNGKPNFAQVRTNYRASMLLPRWRWAANAPAALQVQWQYLFAAIVKHERKHVINAANNYQRLGELIQQAYERNPGLTETDAEQIAQRELRRIRALDRILDRKTAHGRTEGVRGPLADLEAV
jgi:predicted secreted Zn-dependent protease